MIYLLLFILGLCVGSFLNVVIYREITAEEKKSKKKEQRKKISAFLPLWVFGRSYCPNCKKLIKWYDNIPLLSYFLLKAKCRHCQKKISFQYPLIEFLTAAQFTWIYFLIKSNLSFLSRFEGFYSSLILFIWLILSSCFLVIAVTDFKSQLIPDTALITAIIAVLLKIFIDYRFTGMIDFSCFTAAILAGGFFLFLFMITKGKGIGFGDVKLVFLIGLILGFPKIIYALYFSFLTGAAIGVILIFIGKKTWKSKIAFGPFLIAGTLFALFFGNFLKNQISFL